MHGLHGIFGGLVGLEFFFGRWKFQRGAIGAFGDDGKIDVVPITVMVVGLFIASGRADEVWPDRGAHENMHGLVGRFGIVFCREVGFEMGMFFENGGDFVAHGGLEIFPGDFGDDFVACKVPSRGAVSCSKEDDKG